MSLELRKIELDPLTHEEVMQLPEELLLQMDPVVLKWSCACKNCKRFTRVRDYGILPYFKYGKEWLRTDTNYFLCAKHYKYWQRLAPQYGDVKFIQKFIDIEKVKSPFQ